jgi:hypothetical protein
MPRVIPTCSLGTSPDLSRSRQVAGLGLAHLEERTEVEGARRRRPAGYDKLAAPARAALSSGRSTPWRTPIINAGFRSSSINTKGLDHDQSSLRTPGIGR